MQERGSSIVHVIDDDEAVRESLEALLLASGLEAETYASAEEFLERGPDLAGAPGGSQGSCLILDVNMPGMGGLDLLSHLAGRGLHIPTILLTANADEKLQQRGRELGALTVLSKPVTEVALMSAIASAGSA